MMSWLIENLIENLPHWKVLSFDCRKKSSESVSLKDVISYFEVKLHRSLQSFRHVPAIKERESKRREKDKD